MDSSTPRERALALVQDLRLVAGARDFDRLSQLYAVDAVALSPVFGELHGRAGIVASWQTLLTTFADIALEISEVLVDGERVAVLSQVRLTDRSGWFGMPATGSPIDYRIVLLLTLKDGQIVRDERIYDSVGLLERLEKVRIDRELRAAADVQRALLTRTAHRTAFCEAVGHSVPCRAIGGDFFDFVDLPAGAVGIALGDVAGKGPAAALLAALVQGMFAVQAPLGGGPAETVRHLNERLAARHVEARFATLVYAVVAPDGRLTYSNAGHNAPVLLTRRGTQRLVPGGPILGAFPGVTFGEETIQLDDRDTLVMFTDGVTEARSRSDEEFGEARLQLPLEGATSLPPAEVLRRIFEGVREFCQDADQSDDITATVTRFSLTV